MKLSSVSTYDRQSCSLTHVNVVCEAYDYRMYDLLGDWTLRNQRLADDTIISTPTTVFKTIINYSVVLRYAVNVSLTASICTLYTIYTPMSV